jgi:hypothetical protein
MDELPAIKSGGDFLLAYIWQRERQRCIVIGGRHGSFCPELERVLVQFK